MSIPEISIIIPALNEAETLPFLLSDLAAQLSVDVEVIIVDGGSTDGTAAMVTEHFERYGLQGQVVTSEPGRGRQMNRGADIARGVWLAFLHADSRLPEPDVLRISLDLLEDHRLSTSDRIVAAHFSLCFDMLDDDKGFAYRYYEAKALLGRPGTVHGDQGIIIKSDDFYRIERFREDLPIMEDESFADRVFKRGEWFLLPGRIITSPRRFQVEGLKQRQILNALLMNFHAIGWTEFFIHASRVYREQSQARRLVLRPFFRLISDLLKTYPFSRRCQLWLKTGEYVRSQMWQIGFYLDARAAYRSDGHLVAIDHKWLDRFDCWFEPLTNHHPGRFLTSLLVRFWFACAGRTQ